MEDPTLDFRAGGSQSLHGLRWPILKHARATFAAELQRFTRRKLEGRPPSWMWSKADFQNFAAFGDPHCTSMSNFNAIGQCAVELLMIKQILAVDTSPW